MKEVIESFELSIQRLKEALAMQESDITRDAAIQRFEFTVELGWKSIQKFLREEKINCRSPKECLREAFKQQLVEDDDGWLEAFEDRNLTVHTYNEQTAKEIFSRIPKYIPLFDAVLVALHERMSVE